MAGLPDVGFQSVGLSLVPVSGTPYPGANLISVLLRCHGYTLMDRCSTASSASHPRCQQVVINNGWVMDRPGRGCRSVRSDPGPGLPKAEIPEVGEKWGRTGHSSPAVGPLPFPRPRPILLRITLGSGGCLTCLQEKMGLT